MEDGEGKWILVQRRKPNMDVKIDYNLDKDRYTEFIPNLRNKLAEHMHPGHVHKLRRRLLPERCLGKPARWILVRLVSHGYETTLFIRDDDVYLKGFETKNRSRYEFGFQLRDAPLITRSIFLGCDVDYRSMLNDGAMSFTKMEMGEDFVREAVERLSSYKQAVNQQVDVATRNALAGLIFIICESARMDPHYKCVMKRMTFISRQEVLYLWNWGNMSRFLLGWWREVTDEQKLKGIGIDTEDKAAAVVHLVRNSRPPVEHGQLRKQQEQPPPSERPDPSGTGPADTGKSPDQSQRNPSPTTGNGCQQNTPPTGNGHHQHSMSPTTGRTLVEVFTVLANFSLIGTIAVFDDKGGQIIYENYNSSNNQSQDFPALVLTGPYRAISADGQSLAIRVDPDVRFFDKDPDVRESKEYEDDDGETLWELNFSADDNNKVINSRISIDGSKIIKLTHAVLDDAVETSVQVGLKLDGVKTGTIARVDGKITAHSQLFHGQSVQLFSGIIDKKVEAPPSSDGLIVPIPLARSVLAAPLRSPLEIKMKLDTTCPPYHENHVVFDEVVEFSLFEQHNTKEIVKQGVTLVVQVKITGAEICDPPLLEEVDTPVPEPEGLTGSYAAQAITTYEMPSQEGTDEPQVVDAKLNFDVNDDYARFISDLREKLINHRRPMPANTPVLPQQQAEKPARWIYINLTARDEMDEETRQITLAVRDDNVYLTGFRNQNKQWYEFGTDGRNEHLIRGSNFLGCDTTYGDLVNGTSNLVNLKLGKSYAREAVLRLSAYEQAAPADDTIKRHLARLIVMVCESARMTPHYKTVSDGWNVGSSIDQRQVDYISAWASMSRAMMGWSSESAVNRETHGGILDVVQLLLNSPSSAAAAERSQIQQVPRTRIPASCRPSVRGRPLVEVFSVSTDSSVVGRVTVFDAKRGQVIYKNKKHHQESWSQRTLTAYSSTHELALTGPHRAISADGQFRIKVNGADASDESDQVLGEMLWNGYADDVPYNTAVTQSVATSNGTIAVVAYAVLSYAVQATVQVQLKLDGVKTGTIARVHGQITAHSQLFETQSVQLFSRSKEEEVEVPSSDGLIIPIPLARSVLAAPLASPLEIKMNMHAAYSSKEDDVSINETFVFPLFEKYEREIGRHGMAAVSVM